MGQSAYSIAMQEMGKLIKRANLNEKALAAALEDFAYNVKLFGAKGDGVAIDSGAIQAALDEVKVRGGGTVLVPNGVYLINNILRIPSNTRLELAKNAVLKRNAQIDCILINDSDGATGLYGANRNITVIGGILDGNKDSFSLSSTSLVFGHASDIVIRDMTIKNTQVYHAIEINACQNVIIDNCIFTGYTATGSEYLQLDYASAGGFPWFGPYDNTPCRDITISNCRFENGIDGIGSHNSLNGIYHENITITNNTFRNLSGNAVRALNYKGVAVLGNFFEECLNGVAVSVHAADNISDYRISDNHFKEMKYSDANSNGIVINARIIKGTVSRNIISRCGKHGIFMTGSDWAIEGNVVTDCGVHGIFMYGSSNNVVGNNRLIGNGAKGGGGQDIQLGTNSASVSDKILVTGNRANGLGMFQTSKVVVMGNIFDKAINLGDGTNADHKNINNSINGVWT